MAFESRDQLKPFLIDRLTDERATRPGKGRASAVQALSPSEYRAAVMRDLIWLLNTTAPVKAAGVSDYEHVRHSVLNYGLADIYALNRDGVASGELERLIAEAIRTFEPRIIAQTLTVRLVDSEEALGAVEILIEGDLWSLPSPEAVRLRTELDPLTGRWQIKDR